MSYEKRYYHERIKQLVESGIPYEKAIEIVAQMGRMDSYSIPWGDSKRAVFEKKRKPIQKIKPIVPANPLMDWINNDD